MVYLAESSGARSIPISIILLPFIGIGSVPNNVHRRYPNVLFWYNKDFWIR